MTQRHEVNIGAETMRIERGRIARQADGSCTIRYGDTVVLTTACAAKSASGRDFLPLTVDYREYSYAGGRIPGGFSSARDVPPRKRS